MTAKLIQQPSHQQMIIEFNLQPAPDWDDFIPWGKNLIAKLQNSQFNQLDTGADRHKLTFTFAQNRFSLNYETYSDSIWIEADEPNANDGIAQLQTAIAILL